LTSTGLDWYTLHGSSGGSLSGANESTLMTRLTPYPGNYGMPHPTLNEAVEFALTGASPVPATGNERECLVIGDIHGHYDRFTDLLIQEGLITICPLCLGDVEGDSVCPKCNNDGWGRTDKPVDIILLGDVGHFGTEGTPTGDLMAWELAIRVADVILWGNHDRAMVEEYHAFRDFHRHPIEALQCMKEARAAGKLKLAHAQHGFLMTHAGLAANFRDQDVSDNLKHDPYAFAAWINEAEDPDAEISKDQLGVRDSISRKRGGRSHAGGILWRDITEKLYDGFRQVFGHSADHAEHAVRYVAPNFYTRKRKDYDIWAQAKGAPLPSYCVDVGGSGKKLGDNCLAGIYLPDERIVRVDL